MGSNISIPAWHVARPNALRQNQNQALKFGANGSKFQLAYIPLAERQRLDREIERLKRERPDTYGHQDWTTGDPINNLYRKRHPREYGVVIYGSNRVKPGDQYYELAKALGKTISSTRLDRHGDRTISADGQQLHVVSGGGPGIMRAVAEGAMSVPGGHAIGCGEPFPNEPYALDFNPEFYEHKNPNNRTNHRMYGPGGYFDRASRIIVAPGGIGTDQEAFNTLLAMLTNDYHQKLQKPMILLDVDGFFSKPGGLIPYMKSRAAEGELRTPDGILISPQLIEDFFKPVPTIEAAVNAVIDPSHPWTAGHHGHRPAAH